MKLDTQTALQGALVVIVIIFIIYVVSQRRAEKVETFEALRRQEAISRIEGFEDVMPSDSPLSPSDYAIYKKVIDAYNKVLDRQPMPSELFAHFTKMKNNEYDAEKLQSMLLSGDEHSRAELIQNNAPGEDVAKAINDQQINDTILMAYMEQNGDKKPNATTLAYLREQYLASDMNDTALVAAIRAVSANADASKPPAAPAPPAKAPTATTTTTTETYAPRALPLQPPQTTETYAPKGLPLQPPQTTTVDAVAKTNIEGLADEEVLPPPSKPATVSMVVQRPNIYNIYGQFAEDEVHGITTMISSLMSTVHPTSTQTAAAAQPQPKKSTTAEPAKEDAIKHMFASLLSGVQQKSAAQDAAPAPASKPAPAPEAKTTPAPKTTEPKPETKPTTPANRYPSYDPKDPNNIDNIANACLDKNAMGANLDKRKENILAELKNSRNMNELQFACDRAGGSCAADATNAATSKNVASLRTSGTAYDKKVTYNSIKGANGTSSVGTGDNNGAFNTSNGRPIYNNADNSGKLFPEYAWAVPEKRLPDPPESMYGPIEQTALIGTLLTDAKKTSAGSIIKKTPIDTNY